MICSCFQRSGETAPHTRRRHCSPGCKRGNFDFPTGCGLLWREKGESRATAAKQYVAEALADEEGLSVTGMELAEKNGFLELRVLLRYENETGEAVVTIGGE